MTVSFSSLENLTRIAFIQKQRMLVNYFLISFGNNADKRARPHNFTFHLNQLILIVLKLIAFYKCEKTPETNRKQY